LQDADLDQAAGAAQLGLFLNSGQCCIASSRIYVHASIYDAFVEKCKEKSQQVAIVTAGLVHWQRL
jgi:acyl-CoA reductase-like NAD-dependent aldehyde dehydrogenase